jgi:hypothetical protein
MTLVQELKHYSYLLLRQGDGLPPSRFSVRFLRLRLSCHRSMRTLQSRVGYPCRCCSRPSLLLHSKFIGRRVALKRRRSMVSSKLTLLKPKRCGGRLRP